MKVISDLRIKKSGDPALKRVAERVQDISFISEDMAKLWKAYEKIKKPLGIAAPQIGINKAIVICRLNGNYTWMINPTVKFKIGSKKSNEGCESVEGRYIVKRPLIGLVKYTNKSGDVVSKWYTWSRLRIICHETDHLKGICIDDIGRKV